jgi:zinc transport system ATP-binding protein
MTGPVQTATQSVVDFRHVTVRLNRLTILEDVCAQVPRGSATAIIGPNGAGKTTLLLALLGQIPYAGEICVHSRQPGRPARLGYMPQKLDFDRGMPLTVIELMTMGHQRRPLWLGCAPRACRAAREALAAVEAEHLAERPAGALSGGELQRVLLALAIGQEPELLILDEPAAGVDVGGENLLCELFDRLRIQRGFTQIIVTHDLSVVTAHATDVICLNRRVTGSGPVRTALSDEVLAATFGVHLGVADLQAARRGRAGEGRHD